MIEAQRARVGRATRVFHIEYSCYGGERNVHWTGKSLVRYALSTCRRIGGRHHRDYGPVGSIVALI